MKFNRRVIQKLVRILGFDITRYSKGDIGKDPFFDMQRFFSIGQKQVIFDIGANVGQSVLKFRDAFPDASIHSFEPSPTTHHKLAPTVIQTQLKYHFGP